VLIRPRTVDGADPELEVWGARRKRALLEKVLDREVELTPTPASPESQTSPDSPASGTGQAPT
jgi:hypothetical protein